MEEQQIMEETILNETQDDASGYAEEQQKEIRNRIRVGLELSCVIDDVITYAIQQNGVQIIHDIILKNHTEEDMDDLIIRIESDNGLTDPYECGIERIKPGEELHLKNIKVSVNGDFLASLTERITCRLVIKICLGEDILIMEKKEITALAFDQWPGLKYTPELLAAFSMPNHPVVASLLQLAAGFLDKWSQDPSLAGYQFEDPTRVKMMAAAAYAAIQQKNVTYAEPPSSFENFGQRIRLADAVLDQHMGTCMDMTLLYAACLEAMGLNPIMVMMRGHIFAGVWLVEDSFSDAITDDPTQLEKRMSKGIHELLVVECTAMCAGRTKSFDDAVALAGHRISDYENFVFAIDVRRARSMGIRPLPIRIRTDAGFQVEHKERGEGEVSSAPKAVGDRFDLEHIETKAEITRQMQWERKLLDLSLRNMLINMRFTKAVVPLLSSDVSILEDALADGEEFRVLPRPAEMSVSGDGAIPVEALGDLGPFEDFIVLESRHRRLHSFYTQRDLNSSLTKMYRSAKTSLEENGASTLYLALGLLRWTEARAKTARYAPIILVPIEIRRKSASLGYAMRMRDEDAQLNITLLEFLKQNFDTRINGLNPLPMDEHGLDLPKIFAIIRTAVMNLPLWDVIEVGFIGNFSFSQFVMWNDIHCHPEFLQNNKIVRSLIKGAVDWDCTIPETVDTEEAYLPVTVDASQLRAINMAAAGVSFVLHGPPGTGKSQTITAMIANALTKGKTVLFVAEKMAALEVVQKRLEALGIQNFCLELHSNKATKKAVLDQLKRCLEIGTLGFETAYDDKIQDIRNMRAELDAYAGKLHERRAFGKSLRELIDIYEMIPDHGTCVWFDHSYVMTLTESDLEHQKRSLERLIAAGRAVGHPYDHPLTAVHQTVYTQSLKFELRDTVTAYKKALEAFRTDAEAFICQMDMQSPVTEDEWKDICKYAGSVIAAEEIPVFLRDADSIEKEFTAPALYLVKRDAFCQKRDSYLKQWNENFLRMDMDAFREKFEQANRKFFGKGKALALLTSELQAYALFPVETDRIPVYLTDVSFYQKEAEEVENLKNQLRFEWNAVLEKYPDPESLQAYQHSVKHHKEVMEQFTEQIQKLEAEGTLKNVIQTAKDVITEWNVAVEKEETVTRLLALSFEDPGDNWMESRLALCTCILEHASSIKDWVVYRQFAQECRRLGLSPICDAYENGLPHEQLLDIYLRSVYQSTILSVIETEPVLNGFTGTGFNERISQFKKLDEDFMELTKEEMFYQLTHQLPTGYESVQFSKELNTLRRAISSNGRGISIRTLFDEIPHVLAKLCPCMLMSPISVAQYLAAENDLFDIVIFDEASQLPTCKAAGVLARGKNAVIVGDPNQMPPTSFFAGNTVDEDNLEMEDLDSILDDCLALGMPQAHLHWHYRSRHESLIAFSNQEFYENSIFTFPSVNDRERRVSLVKAEGFFDRGKGRVNEGEARAIVGEIKRRYQDQELKNLSLGVVTFNITQQTLIEDLLLEEYQKDPKFDSWANSGEEALFVKNLENVQGDERDVILFSVAFGPDAEGKLYLNFGPLNKSGGWKRLNVAVTRARSEMIVFTTMTADMIDLKRTKSKGTEALKDFLEFAEKGRLQGEYIETRIQKNQGILELVCREITKAGFKYQKSVGHSKFKVDIAVINPYNEEEYLLGIMLDGDSYRQSSNTKDREVTQISVLKGLGWKLHRIWTMDWWDNRDKEISKLLSLLEECRGAAYDNFTAGRETEPEVELEREDTDESVVSEIVENSEDASESVVLEAAESSEMQREVFDGEEQQMMKLDTLLSKKLTELSMSEQRVAARAEENPAAAGIEEKSFTGADPKYRIEKYSVAELEMTPMSTAEYISKDSMNVISAKMQQIIDAEAPIEYNRLMKKTLRVFQIGRSSSQTMEASEKAFKKTSCRLNSQSGVKYCWKKDQDQDSYCIFRKDADLDDRRSPDEICQQELKNAVCVTLLQHGALEKEILIKETIRTMGYARSGAALIEGVERGLKYGRRTGEIVQDKSRKIKLQEAQGCLK